MNMRKKLHEGRAALEVAIVKSLGGAELTVTEVNDLAPLTVRDLMFEYDLDSLMAEQVKKHAMLQQNRQQAQNQYTPLEDFESSPRSLTRTWPITESRGKRIDRLRHLVPKVMKGNRTR